MGKGRANAARPFGVVRAAWVIWRILAYGWKEKEALFNILSIFYGKTNHKGF